MEGNSAAIVKLHCLKICDGGMTLRHTAARIASLQLLLFLLRRCTFCFVSLSSNMGLCVSLDVNWTRFSSSASMLALTSIIITVLKQRSGFGLHGHFLD